MKSPRLIPLSVVPPFIFLARFLVLPLTEKLSFLPDDAFYYFQLAREWSRSGLWSFDGGHSTTTGFHPIFAYFCALLEQLGLRDLNRLLSVHAIVAVTLTTASLVMLSAAARRLFPKGEPTAVLMVGFAGAASILPFQNMEWPFAVTAGAIAAFAYAFEKHALLAVALAVGPLCRTDFVVVGLCLAAAVVLHDARFQHRETRKHLVVTALPTLAGGCFVALHTYRIDGNFLQTSARVKAHWGSVMGYSLGYGAEPASYVFTPAGLFTRVLDFGPLTLVLPLALLIVAYAVGHTEQRRAGHRAKVTLVWAALSIGSYVLLYARIGTAAQCWYSANFFMPAFLLVAALASGLSESQRHLVQYPAIALAVVTLYDARRPVWNAQGLYETLLRHSEKTGGATAAAWNAGTLGYLTDGRAINIDGLVNDDVVTYMVADRVHCYLLHESIPYIIDFPDFPNQDRAKYLGFRDGRLSHAMRRSDAGRERVALWAVNFSEFLDDPACLLDMRSARSQSLRPFQPVKVSVSQGATR